MRKVFIISALSGILLVSCAQNDLVVKPDSSKDSGVPVSFAMNIGNMSRDNTPLHDAGFNSFGVWAVKAANQNKFLEVDLKLVPQGYEDPCVVMNNYWVKYCESKNYGSFWSYVSADWTGNTPVGLPSGRTSQFLKYWDGSVAHTYFVAYGPAGENVVFSNGWTGTASGDPTLTFPEYVTAANPNTNYIYSDIEVVNNANYISGSPDDPKKVPLTFHRILSQLKIAFWGNVPGYNVKLIQLTFKDQNNTHGVVAIPATYNESNTPKWAKGSYISKGKPTVTYDKDDLTKSEFIFNDCKTSQENLEFVLPSTIISNSHDTPTFSPTTYNVIPNVAVNNAIPSYLSMANSVDYVENSGLQFVVNFQLESIDTKEIIIVRGARVFVPAQFTAWEQNTLYTYVFQITKNASGTTTGTDPDPNPDDPDDALYPIIFDQLVVEEIGTDSKDFVINQKLSDSSLYFNITNGFTPSSLTLEGSTPDNMIYTWTSSDEEVATVSGSNLSATVTPVSIGTATITVKDAANKVQATCTVYVYKIGTLSDDTVTVGNTTNLTCPFTPATLPLTWTSNDTSVATVDNSGVVTGVAAGEATITCALEGSGDQKSCKVTVTKIN